jgi:hypothetical protein
MHLKRYKTKLGYKYMILESGTNTSLVNLGCVNQRQAQSELRRWSTEEKRQAAMAKCHLHDETLLFTGYLKEYVTHYLPAKSDKTISSELEAIAKFKTFFEGIALARLSKRTFNATSIGDSNLARPAAAPGSHRPRLTSSCAISNIFSIAPSMTN